MKYIDVHGHINFADYESDRAEVIARAKGLGVGMITVGTDLETSRNVIDLVEANPGTDMWAIVGSHPIKEEGESENFSAASFYELAKDNVVLAIGECGLDYFHSKPEDIDLQKKVFVEQIQIANEVNKPLMLHMRNAQSGDPLSERSVYWDALELLKGHAKVPYNFHFFAGAEKDLEAIMAAGGYVSFTGVITFARNYDELVRKTLVSRIMSETDCPFVAPAPHRGKRNEPSYVIEVVNKIAEIRGEDREAFASQMVQNARTFFSLI